MLGFVLPGVFTSYRTGMRFCCCMMEIFEFADKNRCNEAAGEEKHSVPPLVVQHKPAERESDPDQKAAAAVVISWF